MVYLALPILIFLVLLMVLPIPFGQKPEKREHTEKQGGLVSLRLLKNPVFTLYLFMILFYVGSETGCAYWYVSYFEDTFSNPDLDVYKRQLHIHHSAVALDHGAGERQADAHRILRGVFPPVKSFEQMG